LPVARTAHVQAGATAGELIEAAEKYGLATTTGTVSSVGMTGLTLGGWCSGFMGWLPITCCPVTADGQLITANTEEHPDLLWGLRGGGGNFGVVVSLEYRLHPLTTVIFVAHPLEQSRAVLHRLTSSSPPHPMN